MNKERLEQIFQRYLEKFDEMNITESSEWYKWKVAKDFPEVMNQALASADEAFPDALRKAERVTEDLLDNQYVYPFSGLCQIADKEPGTVPCFSIYMPMMAAILLSGQINCIRSRENAKNCVSVISPEMRGSVMIHMQ